MITTVVSTTFSLLLEYIAGPTRERTRYEWQVEESSYPNVKEVKKGDILRMGQLGTLNKSEFFGSMIHPQSYVKGIDHETFRVLSVKPVDHIHG